MMHLSHKALKAMGKEFDGLFFDGNIYSHENRVHFLSSSVGKWNNSDNKKAVAVAKEYCPELAQILDEIAALECDSTRTEQIAYSCGVYGNTGQLHKIQYFKHNRCIKTLFIYC